MDIFSGDGMADVEKEHVKAVSEVMTKAPWMSKYRPDCIDDIILPANIKTMLMYGLDNNEFTHMILHSGKPGTGKTTTARAIPTQMNTDYIEFSVAESGMDIFDTIRRFAAQKTVDGKPRFVILDECDRPKTPDPKSFYNALQPLIESTDSTLRFILTCNHLHRIPEPIRSRCVPVSYSYDVNDVELKKGLFKRMKEIAKVEVTDKGGSVNISTLKSIASFYYPDIRSIVQAMHVNYLENSGNIDGEPTFISSDHITKIWEYVVAGDYMNMRKYISATIVDFQSIYSPFDIHVVENIDPKFLLNFVVLTGEYQYRAATPSVDQEINLNSYLSKVIQLIHNGKI